MCPRCIASRCKAHAQHDDDDDADDDTRASARSSRPNGLIRLYSLTTSFFVVVAMLTAVLLYVHTIRIPVHTHVFTFWREDRLPLHITPYLSYIYEVYTYCCCTTAVLLYVVLVFEEMIDRHCCVSLECTGYIKVRRTRSVRVYECTTAAVVYQVYECTSCMQCMSACMSARGYECVRVCTSVYELYQYESTIRTRTTTLRTRSPNSTKHYLWLSTYVLL